MAGAGHDQRSGANGVRSGPSWRVDTCSVEVEGVGECLNCQSLGLLRLIAQSFLKDENLNVIFIHVFLNSMYNVILSYATCPVEAFNKAKRRQESGQGSSGG